MVHQINNGPTFLTSSSISCSDQPLNCTHPSFFSGIRDISPMAANKTSILTMGTLLIASTLLTFLLPSVHAIPAVSVQGGTSLHSLRGNPQIELLLHARNILVERAELPTGTCNAQTPCPIAACCGKNGLCGYSPAECGSGNCTSKCDSKAECGQYGVSGKQKCPLSVCCSKFG